MIATLPKAARQSTPGSEIRGRCASLDLGFLEIDQQTQAPARGSQVVETLRNVFVGETLGTFQLDDQHFFDQDIGKVLSHGPAFISYGK